MPGGSWSKMTNPKNSKQTRRLRWRRWRPNRRNGALAAQADRHLWTPWKTSFSGPLLGIPLGMTDDLAKCRRASWLYSWRIIEAVRQCYRLGKPTPCLSPRGRGAKRPAVRRFDEMEAVQHETGGRIGVDRIGPRLVAVPGKNGGEDQRARVRALIFLLLISKRGREPAPRLGLRAA